MEENNQEDLNIFFDETIKTKEEQCGTYTLFHGLKLSFFLQCFRTPSSVISYPGGDGQTSLGFGWGKRLC